MSYVIAALTGGILYSLMEGQQGVNAFFKGAVIGLGVQITLRVTGVS